ncbi:MAG: hypothetical protein IT353_01750 [Gemmatimonadaceae bacterium]|nr:hypothetical protein [Gemmatimonadaceae bacterium]
MRVHDDHLYHGSALIQIAEHEQFTAINALKVSGKTVRVAYKVNDDIAVYLKYASKPIGKAAEYVFTFTTDHRAELAKIVAASPKTYLALVCVKDREICCVPYSTLMELAERRDRALGHKEEALSVLVTVPAGKGMRIYVNAPGTKGKTLGKEVIVARSAFPSIVFE